MTLQWAGLFGVPCTHWTNCAHLAFPTLSRTAHFEPRSAGKVSVPTSLHSSHPTTKRPGCTIRLARVGSSQLLGGMGGLGRPSPTVSLVRHGLVRVAQEFVEFMEQAPTWTCFCPTPLAPSERLSVCTQRTISSQTLTQDWLPPGVSLAGSPLPAIVTWGARDRSLRLLEEHCSWLTQQP